MKRNMTLLLAVMVFISCIFAGCGKNATDDKDITKYYKYLSSSEYNLCVDTVKAIDDYLDNKITFAESDKILNHSKTVIDGISESYMDANGNLRSDLSEDDDDMKKVMWIKTFQIHFLGVLGHYVIEEDDEYPFIESYYLIPSRNEMAKMLDMPER